MSTRLALAAVVLLASCDKKDAVKERVTEASRNAFDAAATAIAVKRELDKVYKTSKDYDLVVSAEDADDAEMKRHEAAMAAMPHVAVGGVTVGCEEQSSRSLKGVSYSKHYRATWVRNGKKIGVSYYSKEEIDAAAFADLLQRLVPIVEKQILEAR